MKRNILILLSLLIISCIAIGAVSAVDYVDMQDLGDVSELGDGPIEVDPSTINDSSDLLKIVESYGGLNWNPLFVIDGVEVASFGVVNPEDIESITILKDASATAVYGARGTNGVILITTANPNGTGTNGTDVPKDVDGNRGVSGDGQFKDIPMEHTALPVVALLFALISLPLVYRRR